MANRANWSHFLESADHPHRFTVTIRNPRKTPRAFTRKRCEVHEPLLARLDMPRCPC